MELKRLIAEDSKSALQSVRTTYGEDALIVSTNKIGSKTEVICAVDLLPDNEPFVDDPATAEVAATAQSAETPPFSASLGSMINSAPPAGDSGLASLVADIQRELLELRESVVTHVKDNPHELAPQPEAETGASLNERSLRQQYANLRAMPLNEQRTWEGSHLFFGRPGAGKTRCIEELLRVHANRPIDNPPTFALIALSSPSCDTEQANEHWLRLARVSQKYGAPCAQAKSHVHLSALITQLSGAHTVLIDTQTLSQEDLQELQPLLDNHNVQSHCCVGADFAPPASASCSAPSTIVTRADLAEDLTMMFSALAQSKTQITAVASAITCSKPKD